MLSPLKNWCTGWSKGVQVPPDPINFKTNLKCKYENMVDPKYGSI
jgi:hypothetical protein